MHSDEALVASSNFFDDAWYLEYYPDVEPSGLAPAAHFLRFGRALKRRPGPLFDTSWYLRRYPDVAEAGINPLVHFLKYGQAEGRSPVALPGEPLEDALWRGHRAHGALLGLQRLTASGCRWVRGQAIWALMRWHASHEQWQEVADTAGLWQAQPPGEPRYPAHPGPWLLEAEALRRLQRCREALSRLNALRGCFPDSLQAPLSMVNLATDEPSISDTLLLARRLAWLNEAWGRSGLMAVELEERNALESQGEPGGLDRLSAAEPLAVPLGGEGPAEASQAGPLVSVILPVYNAAPTLETALRSLAQQRGVNLEVIVVDDASQDGSREVARRFCRRDPRFRLVPLARNGGAYSARNVGLGLASGELITVHDSDDWSHPEKLRRQVQALEENRQWMACLTDCVRCRSDLTLTQWRMDTGWTIESLPSLMFRREVHRTLGYWDRVRVSGDREFLNRIRAHFGQASVGRVLQGVPLALMRDHAASLTQRPQTHLMTMFRGLRHDYQQSASLWHASSPSLYMPYQPPRRLFHAPAGNIIEDHKVATFHE